MKKAKKKVEPKGKWIHYCIGFWCQGYQPIDLWSIVMSALAEKKCITDDFFVSGERLTPQQIEKLILRGQKLK